MSLLTPKEAADLKGVSRSAIYTAVAEGRLKHVLVLGHIGLKESEVLSWQPTKYGDRPGAAGRGGKPKGRLQSEEAKRRISEAQKVRWNLRKQDGK